MVGCPVTVILGSSPADGGAEMHTTFNEILCGPFMLVCRNLVEADFKPNPLLFSLDQARDVP